MSNVRLVFRPNGIRSLGSSEETSEKLAEVAEQLKSRVRVPRHLRLRTRHGVSKRGAYAQLRMQGPGALAWEFGTRTRAAKAPLRRVLRSAG